MLASTVEAPLTHPDFVYEPKYDGVRTLVRVAPGRPVPTVRLWSRAGNDKTAQFPAIVKALQRFALRLREPVLLDGEVVALDGRGEPVSFQHLQSRINRKSVGPADDAPSAFIAFDLLRDGPHDLRGLPLTARRAALERVFGDPGSPAAAPDAAGRPGRPRPVSRGDGPRLGGPDRQTRLVALLLGQAIHRLGQAQAATRAGVRHRRLDRAAGRPRAFRRAAARRVRRRGPLHLCRPRRHGVHRGGAGAADEGCWRRCTQEIALRRAAADDQRDAPLGQAPVGRASALHRVD